MASSSGSGGGDKRPRGKHGRGDPVASVVALLESLSPEQRERVQQQMNMMQRVVESQGPDRKKRRTVDEKRLVVAAPPPPPVRRSTPQTNVWAWSQVLGGGYYLDAEDIARALCTFKALYTAADQGRIVFHHLQETSDVHHRNWYPTPRWMERIDLRVYYPYASLATYDQYEDPRLLHTARRVGGGFAQNLRDVARAVDRGGTVALARQGIVLARDLPVANFNDEQDEETYRFLRRHPNPRYIVVMESTTMRLIPTGLMRKYPDIRIVAFRMGTGHAPWIQSITDIIVRSSRAYTRMRGRFRNAKRLLWEKDDRTGPILDVDGVTLHPDIRIEHDGSGKVICDRVLRNYPAGSSSLVFAGPVYTWHGEFMRAIRRASAMAENLDRPRQTRGVETLHGHEQASLLECRVFVRRHIDDSLSRIRGTGRGNGGPG